MQPDYRICNPLHGIDAPTADQIAELRQRAGLTQAQAGQIIGARAADWSRYERGERRMSASTWACILLALGEHPRLTIAPR